ncbi:DUF378 domain-containing protein [Methanococcoides sp. SA1]|nr:DUF378 domain-containing protein [Methanococcoides sp. SA1]
MERNAFGWITIILVIIGAINWGLVGIANFNLVNLIFGAVMWLENTVYVLVGLSGIWELVMLFKE